ncbi:14534_t:CDS:2, partial [Acaulospora colombiana]
MIQIGHQGDVRVVVMKMPKKNILKIKYFTHEEYGEKNCVPEYDDSYRSSDDPGTSKRHYCSDD